MFGWEFPPFNSGGLGVACEGLVQGLAAFGAQITFVLPKKIDCQCGSCQFVYGKAAHAGQNSNNRVKTFAIDSPLSPYLTSESYERDYRFYANKYIPGSRSVWRRDLVAK